MFQLTTHSDPYTVFRLEILNFYKKHIHNLIFWFDSAYNTIRNTLYY